MYRSLTACVIALGILTVGSGGARAALIPASKLQWTYNWSPTMSPPAVFANGDPSGSVSFTNDGDKVAKGSSNVVATNLKTNTPNNNTLYTLNPMTPNGNYGLNLKISIANPNPMQPPLTGTLNFAGKLSGTFAYESALVDNTFTTSGWQMLALGDYIFKVKMTSYVAPGPTNSGLFGSLGAYVEVANKPITQDTPEPTTLALCGLGAAFGGLTWWRRRKQAVPA